MCLIIRFILKTEQYQMQQNAKTLMNDDLYVSRILIIIELYIFLNNYT